MCKTGRKQGCIFQDFQHSIGYSLFPLPPVGMWQISSSWEDSRSWYCNCNKKPHDNMHLICFHVQTALSRQSSTKNHLTSSDVWFYGWKSELESVLHTFTLFQMFSNGRFLLLWQENFYFFFSSQMSSINLCTCRSNWWCHGFFVPWVTWD